MTPTENLLAKLKKVKKTKQGWSALCPAHEDRKASLNVAEGDVGRALVNCHAGCTTEAIVKAIGLSISDLFTPKAGSSSKTNGKPKPDGKAFATAKDAVLELERRHGPRSSLWTYHDAQGEPVGLVVRWDHANGKEIRPVARHADGWRIGAMPDPRPLYGMTELAKAKRVLVVEGERAVEAAQSIGFTATTSSGGSAAAEKSDWQPLTGKEVWILPDNDAPGRKYADIVAAILLKLGTVVKIIELPGLPEHGDIVEWIDAHGDTAEPSDMQLELEALAHAVTPEELTDEGLEFQPFPVDSLPEPVRGFVKAGAAAIGCDPSYLALPLLTAIASAIGNSRRVQLKRGWYAPPIIWCAIVGESGSSKTPAFKLVMKPIQTRQKKAFDRYSEAMNNYQAELARWEKEYSAWKRSTKEEGDPPAKPEMPACERFIVSDTTVEALAPIMLVNPRGLLLARDELAGWIGSFDRYAGKGKASGDSANWLPMFSAESVTVDRRTGIPPTIYIPQAAVCISGGIQPGILSRALSGEHRESGLAARLLLSCPPRKAKIWTEADIDPKRESELAQMVDRLFDLKPTTDEEGEARPVLVRMTADAKAAWIAYYNAHAGEQADMTGDLAAAWSKLEEYAPRIALIFHFIRWAAGEAIDEERIDLVTMKSAITLTQWFKRETRRVYGILDETEKQKDLRRLIEWIRRKGGVVSAREVQQGCRWLKTPGAAEEALDDLVKDGRGTWQDNPTTTAGGRPGRVFVLNVSATVNETPKNPADNEGSVDVDAENEFPERFPNGRLFPDDQQLPD